MITPQLSSATDMKRRRRLWISLLTAVVLVAGVGLAVSLSRPNDVQAVDVREPQIWLSREAAAMYGRLNVDVMEVNSVQQTTSSFPRWIVQDSNHTVLVGGNRYVNVDPALPPDIDEDTTLDTLPINVVELSFAGQYVVVRDEFNHVYVSTVDQLAQGQVDGPIAAESPEETGQQFVAMNVDSAGRVLALSADNVLMEYDIAVGREVASTALSAVQVPVSFDRVLAVTWFDEHWAIAAQADSGEPMSLWIDDKLVADDLPSGTQLARPSSSPHLYVAHNTAMLAFDPEGQQQVEDVTVSTASPISPLVVASDCPVSAWAGAGQLLTSVCGEEPIALDGSTATQTGDRLEWRKVGSTLVLNNATRGTAWVFEDRSWTFVPSSATWVPQETTRSEDFEEVLQDTTDPMPPMPGSGQNAQFGIRPGTSAKIPVLIGATDPNRGDVISIVPGTVRWKTKESPFGVPRLTDGNTNVVVDASSATTGEATLLFDITDGYDAESHRVPAQVTISIYGYDEPNQPPRYVEVGKAARTNYAVAPGTDLHVDLLKQWVDPEGDTVMLSAQPVSEGTAIATPDGRLTYRAAENARTSDLSINYQVTDALGAATSQSFPVQIRPDAPLQVAPAAITTVVDSTQRITVADYISGASGLIRLGTLSEVPGLTLSASQSPATIEVHADSAGQYTIAYEVSSGATTAQGVIRLTVLAAQDAQIAVDPISVYVTNGSDTQIDPQHAVSNPAQLPVAITDVNVEALDDALAPTAQDVSVDVRALEGSQLRVYAQYDAPVSADENGEQPIAHVAAAFRYNVAVLDGSETSVVPGYGVVYVVPQDESVSPIPIADAVQVRAGGTIDVDVLANDIAPVGTDLVLDPRPRIQFENVDVAQDGLAFASGSRIRILAPQTPGQIEIPYYVYSRGNPATSTRGSVFVTVNPAGGKAEPQLAKLRGQVDRGGQTIINLPTSGIDSDGDEILAVRVEQPQDARVELIDNGRALRVTSTSAAATDDAKRDRAGQVDRIDFNIGVSDGYYDVTVPVTVAVTDDLPQPVAFNDYRYEPQGADITVQPLLNDSIPAGRQGRIIEVNELRTSAGQITPVPVTTLSDDGQSFTATVAQGTTVFEYTIATGFAQDGVFDPVRERGVIEGTATARVVLASSQVSVPMYPKITDTYVSAADIAKDSFNVDVYTNKVVWTGGPLQLALVDSPAVITTDTRTRVAGPLSSQAQIIPFAFLDPSQQDLTYPVESYGFVHVPASNSLRPALRDPDRIYEVTEGDSTKVAVDLDQAIVQLAGRQLEVLGQPRIDGRRSQANARCEVSDMTLTYYPKVGSSQRTDGCTIRVRWANNPDSEVSLRIGYSITLLNAPPQFLSSSIPLRVYPRETNRELDLLPYIAWEASSRPTDKSTITIGCDQPRSSDITVHCAGSRLIVDSVAHTAARQTITIPVWITGPERYEPRIESQVVVSIENGEITGLIEVPDIATTIEFTGFDQSQAVGTVDVLDTIRAVLDRDYFGWVDGRVLPESLQCHSLNQLPIECDTVSSSQIQFTVDPGTQDSPTGSGSVTVSYRFVDTTSPNRQAHQGRGRIIVTYRSVPPRPTLSLERVSPNSVTLSVAPVDSQPAVSQVRITAPGLPSVVKNVRPGSSWRIEVPGLSVNEKHDFTAQVYNGVGWSGSSEPVTAWAYEAPQAPEVSWAPVPNGTKGNRVQLWVSANGRNTGGFMVLDQDGRELASTRSTTRTWSPTLSGVSNSAEQISVIALSEQQDPITYSSDTARATLTVNGVGAPRIDALKQVDGGRTVQADISVGGRGAGYQYGWVLGSGPCVWNTATRTDTSIQQTFDAISSNRRQTVKICVRSVATTMQDLAGINQSRLDGSFGEAQRSNDAVMVVEAPSATEVSQQFKYYVSGNLVNGFKVELAEATIGNVKFRAIRVPNDPDPASALAQRKVRIYLRADEYDFTTSIDQPYSIGPAAGKPSYIPRGFKDGFPDFAGGCTAPDNSTFTFTPPTFEDIRASDWSWEYQAYPPGENNNYWTYSSSSGTASKQWQPREIDGAFVAGEYRVTLRITFTGQLNGLGDGAANQFTRTVTCDVDEPPEEGGGQGDGGDGGDGQGSGADSSGGASGDSDGVNGTGG